MPKLSSRPDKPKRANPAISRDPDSFLTEIQAAEFLALTVRTLQSWRLRGGGPRYVKCGRACRYRRRELIDWTEANTVSHTSQTGTGPAEGVR